MPVHSHDYYEIMFVNAGKCNVHIEIKDRGMESVPLGKNEFILIDSNVKHKLFVTPHKPCNIMNIEVNAHKSIALPTISASSEKFCRHAGTYDGYFPAFRMRNSAIQIAKKPRSNAFNQLTTRAHGPYMTRDAAFMKKADDGALLPPTFPLADFG